MKFRRGRWNRSRKVELAGAEKNGGFQMGRGILLWLLGVPIPIILLLALMR